MSGARETVLGVDNAKWGICPIICMYGLDVCLKRACETLTGVTQLKIRDVCWRASEASETVLGVDNAKSGICYMYVCMYGWMDGTYAL